MSNDLGLRVSAVLTLIGLGLMVWSMLVPTPLPVMLAMTVGQVVGTAAFAIYLVIVVRQLRKERANDPAIAGVRVQRDHEDVTVTSVGRGRAGLAGPHDGLGGEIGPGVAIGREREQARRRRGARERIGAKREWFCARAARCQQHRDEPPHLARSLRSSRTTMTR